MTSAREVNALEAVFDESKALGRGSSWQLAMAAVDAGWVSPERMAKTLARVVELEQQCARLGAQAAGVDRLLEQVRPRTAAQAVGVLGALPVPVGPPLVQAADEHTALKTSPAPVPGDACPGCAAPSEDWCPGCGACLCDPVCGCPKAGGR